MSLGAAVFGQPLAAAAHNVVSHHLALNIAAADAAAGVVSFSRLGSLDDMNVDLTEQLLKAKQKQRQQQQAAAAASSSSSSSSKQQAVQQQQPRQRSAAAAASPSYQYKDLPSKNEARRCALSCCW
jgi:hypothetical protein